MGTPVKSRDVHLFPDFSKKPAWQNPAYHGQSWDFPPFPRKSPDKWGGGVTFEQTIL